MIFLFAFYAAICGLVVFIYGENRVPSRSGLEAFFCFSICMLIGWLLVPTKLVAKAVM